MKRKSKEVTKRQIYAYLRRYGPADARTIARLFDRPVGTIRNWIRELKQEGKVYTVNVAQHRWAYEART